MGFVLQALLYIQGMLASMFVPALVKKFGLRTIFIVGTQLNSLVVMAQILPAWFAEVQDDPESVDGHWYEWFTRRRVVETFLIISVILTGIGSALMWIAQGEYMAKCTTSQSKGFYFGYFWVWYMSAQIIGNLTGALIIERSSGVGFFIIMSLMAFAASLLFCCLIMPTPFPK
jgi:MFS family permease